MWSKIQAAFVGEPGGNNVPTGLSRDSTSTWELIWQKKAVSRCFETWPMIFPGHGYLCRSSMRTDQETRTTAVTTTAMTTKRWARVWGRGPRSLIHVDQYWPHANVYWPCKQCHLHVFIYLQICHKRKAKTTATWSLSAQRKRIQGVVGMQRRKYKFFSEFE